MSAREKPLDCYKCSRLPKGVSFVPDRVANSSIIVLRQSPTTAEAVVDEDTLAAHRHFFETAYLAPNKIDWSEIGWAHVVRCASPLTPTAKEQQACRIYDNRSAAEGGEGQLLGYGGIEHKGINSWVITYEHLDVLKAPAKKIFIERAFSRAKDMRDNGYTPCILMGEVAAQMIWPTLFSRKVWNRESGFKAWVNHFWYGPWPFEVREEKAKPSEKDNLVLIAENARKTFVDGGRSGYRKLF